MLTAPIRGLPLSRSVCHIELLCGKTVLAWPVIKTRGLEVREYLPPVRRPGDHRLVAFNDNRPFQDRVSATAVRISSAGVSGDRPSSLYSSSLTPSRSWAGTLSFFGKPTSSAWPSGFEVLNDVRFLPVFLQQAAWRLLEQRGLW